jgi:ATP:ADP antiporter, AAA family
VRISMLTQPLMRSIPPQQVIEHWTFSLFFCIAELWGAVVISVLFWTLANDVCTVADAKIIYPSLGGRSVFECVQALLLPSDS